MDRKEQYKLFSELIKTENDRYEKLTIRATIFISIISGFAVLIGLVITLLNRSVTSNIFISIAIALGVICLLIALYFAIRSLGIFVYKDVCDIKDFLIEIDKKKYSENDVYSILLGNIGDTSSHNRMVLDKRANYLKYSSFFIFFGIAIFMTVVLCGIIFSVGFNNQN
jgi:hypothetical protein